MFATVDSFMANSELQVARITAIGLGMAVLLMQVILLDWDTAAS